MAEDIKNEELTQTTHFDNIITGVKVGTWQENFQLTALQFEYIKNGHSQWHNWASNILIASITSLLLILAKITSNFFGEKQIITNLELYALGSAIILSIILYVIAFFIPNNNKKTMKKIQDHFKELPEIQQIKRESK